MAEIKVKITGDNADFKRKLAEASAESRAKALEMASHFSKVGDTIKDIGSDAGLGKLQGIMTSLTGGAAAFGAALLAGVIKTLDQMGKIQALTARVGTQAGSQFVGKDISNFISSILTVGPNKTELLEAAGTLFDSGMKEEEVKRWLPRIQKLAVGTGKPASEFAEDIAAGNVGVMRRFQRDPMLRGFAQDFPGRSPLEALGMVADFGKMSTAITDRLATPEGQKELAAVMANKLFGQAVGAAFTPRHKGEGDRPGSVKYNEYPSDTTLFPLTPWQSYDPGGLVSPSIRNLIGKKDALRGADWDAHTKALQDSRNLLEYQQAPRESTAERLERAAALLESAAKKTDAAWNLQ